MKKIAILLAALAGFAFAGCGGSSSDSSTPTAATVDHTAPAGNWGGTLVGSPNLPATLSLTTSGGHFAFYCSQTADMTQEVQPDSAGHFSVAGTSTGGFGQPSPQPTQFTGTVTNHVMTVTLTVMPPGETSYANGPYTVTLGQAAPIFQGACPG